MVRRRQSIFERNGNWGKRLNMAPYDSYDYQSYWQTRGFEDQCERLCLNKVLALIKNRRLLVDIGGGFGRLATCYSPLFEKCLIVDPSSRLLAEGKKIAQEKRLTNLEFKLGELPKLPLDNNSCQTVLMIRVSHHLPDLTSSLKEIHRILKKDGYLILEIANKVHFLARLRAFWRGDWSFSRSWQVIERRSPQNIKQNLIPFSNHHPQKVIHDLKEMGFTLKAVYSVSNFRHPILKRIFPQRWLLWLEDKTQSLLAPFLFGPSIFILAQKKR